MLLYCQRGSCVILLGSTEDALLHAGDIIQRASDLAITGANGTNPEAALHAIADEVDQLLEQMIQIANSAQAGQYLFGGSKIGLLAVKKTISRLN